MKETLSTLTAVQKFDDRLMDLRRRLESLPVELGEQETRYSVLEAEAEKHLVERKRALSWAQSLENDVRDWDARVEKLEQQIRILRDAGAAQVARHEAEQHRGEIAKAEEKAIVLLEKAEKLAESAVEAKEGLAPELEELELFRKTVVADEVELQEEIAFLQNCRDTLFQKAHRSGRDLYEKLMPSRKGRPVTSLRGDSCGGCGMSVAPNDRIKVAKMASIATCRSCSRILVQEEVWDSVREETSVEGPRA